MSKPSFENKILIVRPTENLIEGNNIDEPSLLTQALQSITKIVKRGAMKRLSPTGRRYEVSFLRKMREQKLGQRLFVVMRLVPYERGGLSQACEVHFLNLVTDPRQGATCCRIGASSFSQTCEVHPCAGLLISIKLPVAAACGVDWAKVMPEPAERVRGDASSTPAGRIIGQFGINVNFRDDSGPPLYATLQPQHSFIAKKSICQAAPHAQQFGAWNTARYTAVYHANWIQGTWCQFFYSTCEYPNEGSVACRALKVALRLRLPRPSPSPNLADAVDSVAGIYISLSSLSETKFSITDRSFFSLLSRRWRSYSLISAAVSA